VLHEKVKDARSSLMSEEWIKLLADDGPSLVCLGSSRAIHAAEFLLAKMFAVEPFDGSSKSKAELPFHFSWPSNLDHVFPSAFSYTAAELAARHPEIARFLKEGTASALEVRGTVYADRLKQRKGLESYGVCVVQRRPGGQVWLVLAGVTGPATYAAACLANRLAIHLAPPRPNQPSPVYSTPVHATIREDRARAFGTRFVVESQEILSGPHEWKPK